MENYNDLLEDIANGNVLLFLGAGASVTNKKKYLSSNLIEYYRDIKNISYDPPNGDIVDFVDKVFSIKDYDRDDFDLKIADWLRKNLKIENYHKKLINIPWLSIISTNVDLIIEDAIEDQNLEDKFEIIRSKKEYNKSNNIGDKTKYIKLHGCISDLSKYKLIFSSFDFENTNKYYRRIFNVLKGLSPKVKFLFIGYSFSDRFGNLFLTEFKKHLNDRELYLVDPFIKDDEFNLAYLKSKNISPIKESAENFFNNYSNWLKTNNKVKSKQNIFKNNDEENIPGYLQYKLESFLIPINKTYNAKSIDAKDFYLGEEPNFNVIQSNYDVVKDEKLNEIKEQILLLFKKSDISYPFVFLTGSFGTGKTTFTYRLIQKIIEENNDILAFEITNTEKISQKNIVELIFMLKSTKKIIFYSNHSELDLNFKKVRELRGHLSSNQFEDKSIIFLQSIRENALERFKQNLNPKIDEINIDAEFSDTELESYIEKLNFHNIKTYRSEFEKQKIISDLKIELGKNDQLLLSLYLFKDGLHSNHIIDTYNNFNFETTKKAFLYTSILYKYGIKMPVSLLKEIVKKDWDSFINEVVKVDGKGIFIQESTKPDHYLKPDLFFRIKHRIIAETFVKKYIKHKDLYNYYQNLVNVLPENDTSVVTFINLIKSLSNDQNFDHSKINHLFDLAHQRIGDFQRFIIYYCRNLQLRGLKSDLKKGLRLLANAEYENRELGYSRDSRIIHRKACINESLSRMYFDENDMEKAKRYFDEAYELFEIKLVIDPNSIFSYKDFIPFLKWYTKKWSITNEEKVKTTIKRYNILNKGILNVQDGINQLLDIKKGLLKSEWDYLSLSETIDNLIDDVKTRPYALLLRYQLVESFPDEKYIFNENEIIEELLNYDYIEEVSIFLFNHYGKKLNRYSNRISFYDLIKKNNFLKTKEELNYLYYNFVAESYSYRFQDAYNYLKKLKTKYNTAIKKNPLYWLEQDNDQIRTFKGKIHKNKNGYYEFRVKKTGQYLKAKINNNKVNFNAVNLEDCEANLSFTYTGIWAELIEKKPK